MLKKYCLFLLLLLSTHVWAQEPSYYGYFKELFKGPDSPEQRDKWLANLKNWRDKQRVAIKYDSSFYSEPKLKWINHTFIYVQMMAHDRYFYDPVNHKYTVARYLADLKKRYGGIDAVLIWPTYPNIGVDNRNQFDLTADLPGGKKAVRQMIADFKANGVRVFFPIMIWDHGTRRIKMSMPNALVKEMKDLGADGMNGDTMSGVSDDFYQASKNESYPLALQPELSLGNLKMIEWNRLSWGYFFNYEYMPGVSVYKWFEPKHQVNITNRWAVNKTDDLQSAFFNGIGYNSWENIWTVWNQIPDRYAEAIRRLSSIYKAFPDIWTSNDWEPYIQVLHKGIFASKFPDRDKTVYTFINRDSTDTNGSQIALPYHKNEKYYDLWNGNEIKPEIKDGKAVLSFPIEGYGYGAILVTKNDLTPANLNATLSKMAGLSKRKLKSYSADWKPIPQQIIPIPKTKIPVKTPEGMVKIPGVSNYQFESTGVMIEGNELPLAVGVQHQWEKSSFENSKTYHGYRIFLYRQIPGNQ